MLSAGVPVGGVHFLLGESALGAKNGEKVQLEIAAQEAIAGGVRIFQLRDKTASTESLHTQMETLAHLLDKATRKTGETFTLMINDDLALALALRRHLESQNSALGYGLHLGRQDLTALRERQKTNFKTVQVALGKGACLGISVESLDQLGEADTYEALLRVDYIGAGPVFASPTKPDAAPPVGLAGLGAICQEVAPLPVIAIGGITPDTAPACAKAGAVGVAVVSALTQSSDRRKTAQGLNAPFLAPPTPSPL